MTEREPTRRKPKPFPYPPGTTICHPLDPTILFKIPAKKVFLGTMTPTTPSDLTGDSLSPQLADIGLSCPQTSPDALQPVINDTKASFPFNGHGQFFKIVDTTDHVSKGVALAAAADAATGQWEPSDTAMGYMSDLSIISYYFDDLKANYPGFTGFKITEPQSSDKFGTVDAIKNQFVTVGLNASASVVTGIDKDSLIAVLTGIIKPLSDTVKDYDVSNSRFCCLLLNYNGVDDADGVGFVSFSWRLQIHDYKNKSKDTPVHQTTLDVTAWSVVYDNIDVLEAQKKWVQARHPAPTLALFGIPPKYQFTVFDTLPPAGEMAFNSSLPVTNTVDKLTAIVLYSADVTCLGCLDNTNSSAASSYSISTTSGFTFTMSQTIGTEFSAGFDIELVKATVKISLSLSFSEQWNTSQTETIAFQMAAGKRSFVYKGVLKTRYIYFEPATSKYTYGVTGSFYTNTLVSSDKPLSGDPIYGNGVTKSLK
jgi:hypothetical protein